MKNTHLKAALLGGLVVFVWGMISWMVLPWQQHCIKKFTNESEVARVISRNAPSDGMYALPNTFNYNNSTSQKEVSRGMTMLEKGPFLFGVVHPRGMGKMTLFPFVCSFILQVIGAYIVTWMLLHAKGLDFRKRVIFVTLFGLSIGLLGEVPSWNWWGFTGGFVLANIVDLTIGWFFAGFCIAKVLK